MRETAADLDTEPVASTEHVLLMPAEMAAADRSAIEGGTPGIDLMRKAGIAVADAASRMAQLGQRILVLAGPGNNGGDGYVAAEVLSRRGYRVDVLMLCDPARLNGDAARAFAAMREAGLDVEILQPDHLQDRLSQAGLVIDALFGAGLDRPLDGMALAAIVALGESGVPVLAVDLPSGLGGNDGQVLGGACQAARTVTFFRAKPGHLLYPGRALCGALEIVDIGISEAVLREIQPRTWRNAPALWRRVAPRPEAVGHKYARGHAMAISGGALSSGAIRLSAAAALRAGAGLVSVATPPSAALVNAMHLTAVMVKSFKGPQGLGELLEDRRFNVAVIGPGLGVGEPARRLVETVLSRGCHVVLDADALTSFAGSPDALFAMIRQCQGDVVMTPHEGEFDRLFPRRGAFLSRSKLERARAAAAASGALMVLKGADTVIAGPDGRAAVNDNGTPWLATAGSGDVLAGIITGLLAQGMPPFEAAAMGVWLHGEAGRRCGPALTAEDLEPALRSVLHTVMTDMP